MAHIEAFKIGAKAANPNSKVFVVEHFTHRDIAKGKEIALTLIDQGCDFFKTFGGEVDRGIFAALEENDLYCVTTEPMDVKGVSNSILATGTYSFKNCIADIIGEYMVEGKLENRDYYGDIKNGWVEFFWDRPDLVPNHVKALVEEEKKKLITDQLSIPWIFESTPP